MTLGKRVIGLQLLVILLVAVGPSTAQAGFIHTFNTNAQVTIGDDSPRDGTPDTLYPGGRSAPIINAFYGASGNDRENRGVIEYDISTLSGITLTSAILRFRDPYDVSGYFADQNQVTGYFGDGTITLSDYSRADVPIGFLPGNLNSHVPPLSYVDVDVTAFLQSAINGNQLYAGFVLSQTKTTNGVTFEDGTELILSAESDFRVPAPLEPLL